MKKIFGYPAHTFKNRTSGVDFVRIIQPMKYLKGFKVNLWNVQTEVIPQTWPEVGKNNDILYFNYINNDWGYAAMGCYARKYGCKLVMDMDDDLFDILPDNSSYEVWKKGSQGYKNLVAIINDVDYITCTNSYLRNAIVNNTLKTHDKVMVFPNYVDLMLYKHRCKFKDTLDFTIMHFGSTSHFTSLKDKQFVEGIDRLMYEYPNLRFETVGSFFADFRDHWGERYINSFGDVDVLKWIKKMPTFLDRADVIVAPLSDNVYNRCKSNIKYLETSTYKKPFVGQNIRQYNEVIRDGIDGMLCTTKEDWYSKIKRLIEDKKLRKSMGENAFKNVQKHTIQGNIEAYKTFFNKVLDK